MGKGKIVLLVLVGVALSFSSASAQKMKIATALRMYAPYALPLWAAEDKGIWKQNGLDAEWFPFKNGPAMSRAIAIWSALGRPAKAAGSNPMVPKKSRTSACLPVSPLFVTLKVGRLPSLIVISTTQSPTSTRAQPSG